MTVVLISPDWLMVALVLTAVGVSVIADSARRTDRRIAAKMEEQVLRSRVAHYVRIAKVRESRRLVETATNPFERALMHRRSWTSIPQKDLRAVAESTLREVDETAFAEGRAD